MDAVLTADGHGDVGKVCQPVNLYVLEVALPYFKAETNLPVLTSKITLFRCTERVVVKIHAFFISTLDASEQSSWKYRFDKRLGPRTGPEKTVVNKEYLALTKFAGHFCDCIILLHLCLQWLREIISAKFSRLEPST
jgi:hypothetical protein